MASDSNLEPTTSNPNPELTASNRNSFLARKAKLHKPTADFVAIPVTKAVFDNSVAGGKLDDSIAIVIPFHKTFTSITSGTSALSSCKVLDVYLYALKLGLI